MQDRKDHIAALTHVTLHYENDVQALNDVSLAVRSGERLCVLGANGSGKSTLTSVLCGLLAPDQGCVELLGERVYDAQREHGAVDFNAYARVRRSIGLVFQNPDDQIVTTVVEEDVAFGPENLGVPPSEIGVRVERELRRVAMVDYAKADPTRLSGGQKQRVAIAGALAMEPRLIVFDEPGSLLDVRGRRAIMRVMGRLAADGATIVHVTHFMEEALEADRVVVLNKGRIALEGTPAEVFAHAHEIRDLGLEEPFVARLSERLGLPWTCDEDELVHTLVHSRELQPATDEERQVATGTPLPSTSFQTCPVVAEATNVCFSYGDANGQRALDDVSLAVHKGESMALVGQTGSGKSTLLRLLCALEAPDAGNIVVSGINTRKKRNRRRLHGTIGYVMQHPERQLFAQTVAEDVAFGPKSQGLDSATVQLRCAAALNLVGLHGMDDVSPFELSGGQQRLCAIAGVLAMHPRIIVLDEPTAGLDPRGRAELRFILQSVHDAGVTTIEVTHSMDDAALADKVVVLDQNHVLMAGDARKVFCAANAKHLERAGLGVPTALEWTLAYGTEVGLHSNAEPLTLDELAWALTHRTRTQGGSHGA